MKASTYAVFKELFHCYVSIDRTAQKYAGIIISKMFGGCLVYLLVWFFKNFTE